MTFFLQPIIKDRPNTLILFDCTCVSDVRYKIAKAQYENGDNRKNDSAVSISMSYLSYHKTLSKVVAGLRCL